MLLMMQAERLAGLGSLPMIAEVLDKYCDKFVPLWKVERGGFLTLEVNECEIPGHELRKVADKHPFADIIE